MTETTTPAPVADEHRPAIGTRLPPRVSPEATRLAGEHCAAMMRARETGDTQAEEQHLLAALETDPWHPEALFQLGASMVGGGEVELAEAAFRRAIVADPTHAKAHYNLVYLLSAQGRADDALEAALLAVGQASFPDTTTGVVWSVIKGAARGWHADWANWERYRRAQFPKAFATIPTPEWQGEAVEGKRLLVVDEGLGVGAAIFALRWVPTLANLGGAHHYSGAAGQCSPVRRCAGRGACSRG